MISYQVLLYYHSKYVVLFRLLILDQSASVRADLPSTSTAANGTQKAQNNARKSS